MKVMKTMLASLFGHSMIDIGTQAIAGIGRRISTTGMNRSRDALIFADRQPQRHADRHGDEEAEQDAPDADGDVDEILVRQPDLRQLLIHFIGRRDVLEANVELEPVLGSDIPEQEQGPDRDAGKCCGDDPLAGDLARAGPATPRSAKPSGSAPAPERRHDRRRRHRPKPSAAGFAAADGFTAATAGSGSDCLSIIGSATIFALAMLPIGPPIVRH